MWAAKKLCNGTPRCTSRTPLCVSCILGHWRHLFANRKYKMLQIRLADIHSSASALFTSSKNFTE